MSFQKSSPSRTKRELSERKTVSKVPLLSGKNKKLVSVCEDGFKSLIEENMSLTCDWLFPSQTCDEGLKCVELKCPLQSIKDTTVELRSRLWNSTFIEVTTKTNPKWQFFTCLTVFFWESLEDISYISCFFLATQDYASLSHLPIVVTASLVLHSAAKNMAIQTPYTEVSSSSFVLKNKLKVSQLYSVYCSYMYIYIFIFYMSNVKIFTSLHSH